MTVNYNTVCPLISSYISGERGAVRLCPEQKPSSLSLSLSLYSYFTHNMTQRQISQFQDTKKHRKHRQQALREWINKSRQSPEFNAPSTTLCRGGPEAASVKKAALPFTHHMVTHHMVTHTICVSLVTHHMQYFNHMYSCGFHLPHASLMSP